MHLAIDLRFLNPEPFGLSIYIRGLFRYLGPKLQKSKIITKITYIVDARISKENIVEYLPELGLDHQNVYAFPTFSRHYSISEQTTFLKEINSLNADIVYFFTFNYPVLYSKTFLYQIFDTSHLKTFPWWHPKTIAIRIIMIIGVYRSKMTFFLGQHTRKEVSQVTHKLFDSNNSQVVQSGVANIYMEQLQANQNKSKLTKTTYSKTEHSKLEELKNQYLITDPYFLFISVWRPYKNIVKLVQGFEKSQASTTHQLVIAGKVDPKYQSMYDEVIATQAYKDGRVIITGMIKDTEDIVRLQDGAEAFVGPSLSEGFGMWMLESATRGTPILCNDMPVFRDIMSEQAAQFFDAKNIYSIAECLDGFLKLSIDERNEYISRAYSESKTFSWDSIAKTIYSRIVSYAKK